MRAYVDSDVLIWHLRGEKKALRLLKRLFMRPGEEEEGTELFLFNTAPVDESIVDAAASLYRTWHPSHGIDVNDALLAAAAMQTGGRIFCLNLKHYPMPGLHVTRHGSSEGRPAAA